ncbi:MAG: hypothetical protein V4574_17990 [Pseudomonadota bacterium]
MTVFTGDLGLNITPGTGGTLAIASDPTVVGTVSNGGAGSGAITGTGTLFGVQFSPGDTITVGAETQTVIRVFTDTSMATTPFTASFSGASYAFASPPALRFRIFDNGNLQTAQTALTNFAMVPQLTLNNGATTAAATMALFQPRVTYTGSGASRLFGVRAEVNVARTTTAPDEVSGAGLYGTYGAASTNTQNWPAGPGNFVPCGVYGAVGAVSGAAGTIAHLSGMVALANGVGVSGVTFEKMFGYLMQGVDADNLDNGVGAGIYDVQGDNRAYVVLSPTARDVPSGNWAIWDDTGYDTRLKGAVLIGASSDLVIDANAILHQYGVALPKNNDGATAAPVATDDSTADYSVGSTWFWPATGRIWRLRDATASAAEWVELALADEQGYISGNWYLAPDIAVAAGTPPTADAIQLVPLVIKARVSLASLGVRIVTAEHGGNLQLALYANDPATGRPTSTAVAATASISTASTGPVSAAIAGGAVTLEPGLYWAGFNLDSIAGGMVAVQVPSPESHPTAALIGTATQANLGASASDDLVSLFVAQAYGSWPDLTAATFVEGSTPSRNGPAIHFQVA